MKDTVMADRRWIVFWVLVVSLVCAFANPSMGWGQCGVTGTNAKTTVNNITVTKFLSGTLLCGLLSSRSAHCVPDPSWYIDFLQARARKDAASPFCRWNCLCGDPIESHQFTISGRDGGLPVELMDFSVD